MTDANQPAPRLGSPLQYLALLLSACALLNLSSVSARVPHVMTVRICGGDSSRIVILPGHRSRKDRDEEPCPPGCHVLRTNGRSKDRNARPTD